MKIDEETRNAEVIYFEDKWIDENPKRRWTSMVLGWETRKLEPLYWGTGSRSYQFVSVVLL